MNPCKIYKRYKSIIKDYRPLYKKFFTFSGNFTEEIHTKYPDTSGISKVTEQISNDLDFINFCKERTSPGFSVTVTFVLFALSLLMSQSETLSPPWNIIYNALLWASIALLIVSIRLVFIHLKCIKLSFFLSSLKKEIDKTPDKNKDKNTCYLSNSSTNPTTI